MDPEVISPNQPAEEAHEPNHDSGSEDEAVNAFEKRESEAKESTETPADEPEGKADEEPDDGEPEEADPEEKLDEVEFEGKQYELPPEIAKAVLRQADYSRKMNEVGAKEKDAQQRIETADKLIEGVEKFAKVLAKSEAIDAQLAQFEAVDWDALEVSNPAHASMLAVKLIRLQQAKASADGEAKTLETSIQAERSKLTEGKRADMVKVLSKELPGWGDELGTKVTQYALAKGYSVPEIQSITDPKWVIAMDKARKFDAIQDGKKAVQAKAKDAPPVVKPGAKRPAANPAADAIGRLRKSNSSQDAEAAFLARMQ